MRKLMNAMLASLFIFAVVATIPQYTDFIDNPGKAATSGPQVPEIWALGNNTIPSLIMKPDQPPGD